MIYIISALIVVAVLAFYAGWHTGYVDSKQDEPFDEDKWMNA